MSQANFGTYIECSINLAVDLVNSLGSWTGKEYLPDLDALADFLARRQPSYKKRLTTKDLEEVRAVRGTLLEVFRSPDESAAAKRLNQILTDTGARPELTSHDGEPWHLHFSPPGAGLGDRLAAEAAMALSVLIAEGEWNRVHFCEGDQCNDVFVDQSKNRSRRYCSPQICGNRASVAAYRARQRGDAAV